MLRPLGLIAVCACIVASVGCDGGKGIKGITPTPPPGSTVTVEFGGRVVNADVGGPVGNVRVSAGAMSYPDRPIGWDSPKNTATSAEDGTFALPLNLPSLWSFVRLNLTAPPGYDDTSQRYEGVGPFANPSGPTAADRPAIRMYPTLVSRPGESIEVRVDRDIYLCGSAFEDVADCRRVLVAASPGDPVELEIVPDDSSEPMALTLRPEAWFVDDPDLSVRRLMVPPGGVPYVLGVGTATLTARR